MTHKNLKLPTTLKQFNNKKGILTIHQVAYCKEPMKNKNVITFSSFKVNYVERNSMAKAGKTISLYIRCTSLLNRAPCWPGTSAGLGPFYGVPLEVNPRDISRQAPQGK